MGTNFYIRGHRSSDDPEFHIGKRSAAGLYCWDCGLTLCKSGENWVHNSRSEWYDACPKCGKTPNKEMLESSSAGRELGFNTKPPKRKTGVSSCSSFSWAMEDGIKGLRKKLNDNAGLICPCCEQIFPDAIEKGWLIENEYGDLLTMTEFERVLEECPIQFHDSIGQYFS